MTITPIYTREHETANTIVTATLYYNKQLQAFVAFSDAIGVMLFSPEGNMLFHDPGLKVSRYDANTNLLVTPLLFVKLVDGYRGVNG